MSEESPILLSDHGAVRLITLNRPHRLNALNQQMADSLKQALAAAAGDASVKVLVFTGAGRAFSAGADLEMFDRINREGGAEDFTDEEFPAAFLSFPKPMIAAINGPAVGWGSTMPLLCDLRLASSSAEFRFPFVNLGLTPEFVSSWFLPRLVGLSRATELVLTGRKFEAREAYDIGYLNRVTSQADLLEEAMELAGEIAAKPPLAVARAKALLREGLVEGPETAMEKEARIFCQGLGGEELRQALPAIMRAIGKK